MTSLREEIFDTVISNYNGGDLVGMKQVFQDTIKEIEKRIDDLIEDVDELRPKKKYQETKNVLLHIKEMLK